MIVSEPSPEPCGHVVVGRVEFLELEEGYACCFLATQSIAGGLLPYGGKSRRIREREDARRVSPSFIASSWGDTPSHLLSVCVSKQVTGYAHTLR